MKSKPEKRTWLDKKGLPLRAGVYLTKVRGEEEEEMDVYRHWKKGLCCFSEEFGSSGSGVDDRYDCHVSVQFTGLTFIRRFRNMSFRGRSQGAGEKPAISRRKSGASAR